MLLRTCPSSCNVTENATAALLERDKYGLSEKSISGSPKEPIFVSEDSLWRASSNRIDEGLRDTSSVLDFNINKGMIREMVIKKNRTFSRVGYWCVVPGSLLCIFVVPSSRGKHERLSDIYRARPVDTSI